MGQAWKPYLFWNTKIFIDSNREIVYSKNRIDSVIQYKLKLEFTLERSKEVVLWAYPF